MLGIVGGTLTSPPDDRPPPMAAAMQWVSRITVIALEMVLPGLAGDWLDKRWGTGYLALLGFGLGMTLGIWHLLAISKATSQRGVNRGGINHESRSRDIPSPDNPDSPKGPKA